MSATLLADYKNRFENLHTNRNRLHGSAPHKPVLLLAILWGVERGAITHNDVKITPDLVADFRQFWRVLVNSDYWKPTFVLPFQHLTGDGFWKLMVGMREVQLRELRGGLTLAQLATQVERGRFARDLWTLIQDNVARSVLMHTLVEAYFQSQLERIIELMPPSPLELEAERLRAEADRPFRIRIPAQERVEDGFYVRHALFPTVVRELYGFACAVCGADAQDNRGRFVVQAAHIIPFSYCHNDNPRNGIALCGNHHTGFDHGWFCISDDLKIIVSPKLRQQVIYVQDGQPLSRPIQSKYSPAPEAIAWHRDRWMPRR